MAAAGMNTHTIRLGTWVVSLSYHHPFNVAQRIVQLDHMRRGRAMFGSGPGALPSDARTMNIDPMLLRDRQDEALGVIIRLLRGDDRFDHDCDWFTLRDAARHILPMQENMPMVTASCREERERPDFPARHRSGRYLASPAVLVVRASRSC